MDFRTRRKLAVISAVAIVVIGAGALVVNALLPDPTCEDGKQNQKEEGIDCGGPCVPCAVKNRKALEVFWTRFVQSREGNYDIAAEVRNPNAAVGAPFFRFEFQLFDDTGILVATRSGTAFIYPNETMHVMAIGISSNRVIRNATLTVSDERWEVVESPPPDIVAGNREYVVEIAPDGARRGVVRTQIQNRTVQNFSDVPVRTLVFDAEGNLLGVHETRIPELRANEVRAITFTWPGVLPDAVSTILIEARSPASFPSAL